jgi:PKHD-type hydroxylase
MNLNNYYWFFEKAVSHKICDDIIKTGLLAKEQIGITGQIVKGRENNLDLDNNPLSKKEIKILKKTRDSNIAWLDYKWIYNQIHPYIHTANKNSKWNFQWDFSESCQFTKYKLNQHYDWHCDSWNNPYDTPQNLRQHGKIRKLSLILALSDSSNYEGGKLEFQYRNGQDPAAVIVCKELSKKGSIVVFPSFVWHRVTPVTKGTRYSLVTWCVGNPFI